MADRPSSDDLITYVKHGNIEGVKKCINSGVDINREDNDFNQTPVTWAAEYGYMEILNILIESGADIHIPDLDGWTPLHYAAGSNESDMVQKLLDAGADINLKTNDCKTPLHTAAQRGNEASISVLIEYFRTHNASIDPVDNRGGTPLYYAASEASADVVRQLCNAGSNVNGLDPRARPLIAAARTGENVTVEVLLEKGADPKLPDKDGQLPIYWAAKAGSLELVELFLRTLGVAEPDNMSGPLMALWKAIGADGVNKVLGDVRTTDKDGWTALHLAASIGHANAIKALVAAKSHVNALDRQGRSPLLLAAENGKGPSIKALLDDNSKAVDVNIKDKIYERTALSWAAYRGDTEAVGLLAQAGSDVDSLDEDGQTPLILATRNGHSDSITKLLTFKPDLNIRDAIFEQSAVSYAAEKGHTEVVKLLIEAGCNIYSQTRERFSPLERAAQRGDPELLRLFFGLRSDGEPHPEELVRVKAIAEALHHACNNDYSKTRDLILAEKRYLTSTDEDGRTVLSWTVERGSEKTVKFLLDNGAKPDATDSNNRTPLSWAAERGSQGTVELLLASGVKPDAKDSNSRTPLSWAAGSGSQATVKLLLANGVKPDAKDSNSRTPLSWAAGSGSEETVELLLEKNVRPDSTDINNRTPLSWAAERGSLAVVKKLLSEMQISGPLTKKDQKAVDSTGKPQLAVDLKANDSNWTALWYAANGGHLKVTEALLEGGADPLVEDKEGINLMQYLSDGSSINLIGRNGIQKMLEPFFSLLAHSLPIFEAVEEVFQGMVLQFPKSRNREIKSEVKSVGALLISEEHDKLSKDSCLNWIHLPANNMRWIEILIRRHYEACGQGGNQNHYLILKPELWADNQNIPQDKPRYHERFMRSGCHVLPLRKSTEPQSLPKSTKDDEEQCIAKLPNPTKQATKEKENETKKIANSSIDKENDDQPNQAKTETGTESDACPKAFVLFVGNDTALYSWPLLIKKMPYLHWECAEEVRKHKKILEENKAENQERSRSVGKDIEERKLAVTGKPMDDTEKLLWMFLGEDHPLHIRRTLDQYYYPNSSSIEDRDKDQTTLRYFEDQCLDSEEFDRVLTMVDQLWMWVLPRCGSSPPTILTAFPQRSNRKNSKRPTALVNNIQSKCRDLSRWSSYDVAKVIVAECSRIYFHSTSNRKKPVEFLDVYRTSIGRIMDRDATRFRSFQETIGKLNKILGLAKPRGKGITSKKPPNCKEILQELSSFEEDVEDLRIICENSGTIQTERSESHKLSTPEKISKQLPRMQKDIEALRAIYSTSDPSQAEQGNGTDSKKSLDDGEILPKLSKIKEEIKYLRSSCKKLGITSLNREEVLRELLDIKEDIEDLRQIKDIRDELNMMDSIFRTQDVVIEEMDRITQSWEGQNGIKTISHEVPNRRLVSPYHQHPVVERNLAEVKRLDDFAEKAKEAIEQLLALKQKQADLVLTKSIYNINDATDKQGNTLLMFTAVTIIFLPLSFMTSFLALNVAQFPWDGEKLPLKWVVQIILAVSLPLSVLLLPLAFSSNESQRKDYAKRFGELTSAATSAVEGSTVHVQSAMRSVGLRKRNHNQQRDAEEGTNGTSAPQNGVHGKDRR